MGMRQICEPLKNGLETATGTKDNATVALAADFLSNIAAAGITFPIHQLFNYTVSTPEMWDKPQAEQIQMAKDYLNKQYFITKPDGGKQLSPILLRDFGLRSLYIGCCYTMYINLERAAVKYWPF